MFRAFLSVRTSVSDLRMLHHSNGHGVRLNICVFERSVLNLQYAQDFA